MGVSLVSRLMFISYWPPVPDNLGVFVNVLPKRSGWHKILLERIKTCRQKMKDYYEQKAFDDPAESYIHESDIPKDCAISAEAISKDIDLNPVAIETTLSPQPQKIDNETKGRP